MHRRQGAAEGQVDGLQEAHVAANGKKKIVVAGKKFGHYKFVTFAKAPGCPVKW
jgi:hypothetical protein